MLVSELFDATFAEWLYPAGISRPAWDTLFAAIDADDTELTLTGRVENVPRDTVLEIDDELILTSAVSQDDNPVVTVGERGWLNTDGAVHALGAQVRVDPKYPRKALLGALNALLGDMYGQGVYATALDTSQLYTTQGTIALPAGGRRLLSVRVDIGPTAFERWHLLVPGKEYDELRDFEPSEIQFFGGHEGREMRLFYAKAMTQATLSSDDLDTLGVPESLQPHLSLGIAGRLLTSREIPRVQLDEIKRQLATQGIQVGSALNVGQALTNQYRAYVQTERLRLSERRSHDIVLRP